MPARPTADDAYQRVAVSRYAMSAARSASPATPANAMVLPGTILPGDASQASRRARSQTKDCARSADE